MSRRILLTSPTWRYAPGELRRLSEAGFVLEERYDIGPAATSTLRAAAMDGVWGVIAGGERYDREVLAAAKDLRVIARPGAGYDAIDMHAASDAGVLVFTTPGVNRHAVADFAVTLMLAVLRHVVTLDTEVRSGAWRAAGPARDLHGATVGIVGLGAIGRTVARRLSGFECRVIGSDPMVDAATAGAAGIELLPFAETLAQAEVITLHTALTPETFGIIGPDELRAMRADAVLVNTARGPIVQQAALYEALIAGEIAAAALDVFEHEPLTADDPLVALPNVLLSSHVASHTRQSIGAMVGGVADGILAVAAGEAPAASLNPEVMA